MAKGNIHMEYAVEILTEDGLNSYVFLGYDDNDRAAPALMNPPDIWVERENYRSLNEAVSHCLSWVRQLQAEGKDCKGVVTGVPYGDPSDNPTLPMPTNSDLWTPKIYAWIDTPGKGLVQRIKMANKTAHEAGGSLSDDVAPDLAAVV